MTEREYYTLSRPLLHCLPLKSTMVSHDVAKPLLWGSHMNGSSSKISEESTQRSSSSAAGHRDGATGSRLLQMLPMGSVSCSFQTGSTRWPCGRIDSRRACRKGPCRCCAHEGPAHSRREMILQSVNLALLGEATAGTDEAKMIVNSILGPRSACIAGCAAVMHGP